MRDVRGHLGNDRDGHVPLHVGGVERDELGVLTDVRPHSCQSHLRAREVQLYGIHAGFLSHLREDDPLPFRLSHDRCHDNLRGIVLLQPLQDVEVHAHRVLAQLLHVTEAVEVADTVVLHGIETRRHLIDVLHADGLIEHSSPTGFKRPCHHVVVRTDGRRCKEEGILTMQTTELDGQVGLRVCLLFLTCCPKQLPDTDGLVVMDARLLGCLQVFVTALCNPLSCKLLVVKSYRTDGTCRVASLTCLAAGCIGTQQTAGSFFSRVKLSIHNV